MSRTPNVDKNGMKKGPWSKEEDDKLRAYIQRYGHWNWREIPRFAGVSRCGKSCRLRWMNYLRPNMKHGNFTKEEEDLIMELHRKIGNKWATIAAELPGRSDNEIKNHWHTHLRKRVKKNDQNENKIVNDETSESIQTNSSTNMVENSNLGDLDELWASLSSEISFADTSECPYVPNYSESISTSSYSSSAELTSAMFNASDSLVSSGDSMQSYNINNELYNGNFWTDPFLADYDHGTRSTDEYSLGSDFMINTLMAPTSCHDITMSDEFQWSSLDLYSKYQSQFMK